MQIDTSVPQMHLHENEEEKKESDTANICHFCGITVTGPALQWNGVDITGALACHLDKDCPYIRDYNIRIEDMMEKWKQYIEREKLKPYSDIRSFFDSHYRFFTVSLGSANANPFNQANEDWQTF
jgi:hypothetical protein